VDRVGITPGRPKCEGTKNCGLIFFPSPHGVKFGLDSHGLA